MGNFNVNQSSVDRLDTFRAVFINSPMFRLLGKDCKTGVNLSNVSSLSIKAGICLAGGAGCRDIYRVLESDKQEMNRGKNG